MKTMLGSSSSSATTAATTTSVPDSPRLVMPCDIETFQPPEPVADTTPVKLTDPTESYQEALQHPGWKAATDKEMQALNDNHSWSLVPLPTDKKLVSCKSVYTFKHNPDGSIAQLKGQLVAKGYTQCYGIDYEEAFSLVAK
ncbi:uncharacterized mitochondrial protein AtMg00820-like [Aristolochia californica]|uniref:uncharacterized mitochondrial protein AtMg00820-like n=1 Tax=Aristolochia californica TaxID=171875 RepID=UPI0035DDE849